MRASSLHLSIVAGFAACVSILVTATTCGAQQPVDVTFEVVTAVPIAEGEQVYVTGNAEALGNWHPRGFELERTDSSTWRGTASLVSGSEVEFKITKGSWQREALRPDGSVPPNQRFVARRDTTLRIVVTSWKSGSDLQVTGDVRIHRDVSGPGVEPRDISVWLPPGYSDSPDARYAVLYANDGQNLFDPETSFTGVDWQLDEHADSLILTGRMQGIIIVGIHNTVQRSEEYHDTELGSRYRSYVVDVVKPMIDATYRTLPGREHTAVMGSSSGGFAAFLFLLRHPDVFSAAACLSPYFPESLPPAVVRSGWEAGDLRLYIDNGGDDLDSRLQEGVDRMLPVLKSAGFERGDNLMWVRYPDDGHNESAWAARVWRALLFMFGPTP